MGGDRQKCAPDGPEVAPDTDVGGPPRVQFKAGALGRQYKYDFLGKRLGIFGPKTKAGLGARIPRPRWADKSVWANMKPEWARLDEVGKFEYERKYYVAVCVDVGIQDDIEGKYRKNFYNVDSKVDNVITDLRTRTKGHGSRAISEQLDIAPSRSTPISLRCCRSTWRC